MEFSQCELGDRRRTQRLVKAATQALARPDGSTPRQIEFWSDCKALDRLMDCEDVSFQAIAAPHYARSSPPRPAYAAFEAPTAHRLSRRLRIVHTPRNGSWLNFAEMELSVLTRQCLNRRFECAAAM